MCEKRKKNYFRTKWSINKINILGIIFNFGITLFFCLYRKLKNNSFIYDKIYHEKVRIWKSNKNNQRNLHI